MPTYTVISQVDRHMDGATASPIAAIAGDVEVFGFSLHTAHVVVENAEAAMSTMRGVVCDAPFTRGDTAAATWTVIGVVDKGVCPSWSVVAIVVGVHEVLGRYDHMLTHRWVRVIDDVNATSVDAADSVAWKLAAEMYDQAWD